MLQNRFLLVQFSKEYLWTPSSTWGILSASKINEGRKIQKLQNNGVWCPREALRQPQARDTAKSPPPPRVVLWGSDVALTISKHLATTKLKWLCTSVSHDVLDSYRKQDRTKQEHSRGAQLQITILANTKGCIPLWVDASTTWSKCCVFLRIKATPVQVKTIAE